MRKTACFTRRHKALRRTALVLVLLLLIWLTPFYHLIPGQVTRREAKDRMLEGSAEILETQYLWEDHTLRALQLSRTEESTLLILARWSFLTGWGLESSSRAQPGVSLDAGFLQCAYEDAQGSWGLLASFGRLRSPEIAALKFSARSSGLVDGVWTEGGYTSLDTGGGSFPTREEERYFLRRLPLEVGAGAHWNVSLEALDSGGETVAVRTSDDYWAYW